MLIYSYGVVVIFECSKINVCNSNILSIFAAQLSKRTLKEGSGLNRSIFITFLSRESKIDNLNDLKSE